MAQASDSLPPPPSYEEAQLNNSRENGATSDEDTPPSAPLMLHSAEGVPNTTSNVCLTSSAPAHQGAIVPPGGCLFKQDGFTDGSNAQGILPVFVCTFCGARQQFGPFSPFVPQGPAVSGARYIAPPVYVGQPVISNQYGIQGQSPGYPATGSAVPVSSASLAPQQQCNVAVHYNTARDAVQTQPVNSENSTTDQSGGKGGTYCIFCVIFMTIVTVVIVAIIFV